MSVLRSERGGELRGSVLGLPVPPAGGQIGAAAESPPDPEEAGREQRFEGPRQHIREELEGRPQEEALA